MSTMRISCSSAGIRFDWVRMMSGRASASSRPQHPHVDAAVGHHLGVDQLLQPGLEVGRHLGQVEVHPGLAGLHVAAGDQRPEVAEHHAAQHVQAGVGPHEHGAPARPRPRRSRSCPAAAPGRPAAGMQVEVVALAGVRRCGSVRPARAARRGPAAGRRRRGRRPTGPARSRPRGRPGRTRRPCSPTRAGVGSARSSRCVRP